MAGQATGAILLVDGNSTNLAAMRALVEGMGRAVLAVTSGPDAIASLAQHEVSLIVMAVKTSGLDGFDTVAKIRAEKTWGHIPIVFFTAIHDDPATAARGYALGAVDYVTMPFNAEVLTAKLRALVGWYEQGEQRRLEAEILASERAAHAERERILGIVAHDLRSPLAIIQTGADYLDSLGGLGEDQAKIVGRVQRTAARMARLINDLLDFTRMQNGPLTIRPRPASLAEIVAESVEDIQLLSQRAIEVSLHTTGDTTCDEDRVTQAITNLVLNAMQHAAADARITVGLREQDGGFEVDIWNEGEIAAKDAATLFQPFRKGRSSAGMGLGLYISQQIARAHGGDLTLTTSAASGTTFRLRFPVVFAGVDLANGDGLTTF